MRKQRFCDDKTLFYRNVFALVLPMALQNLINVGITSADVIMLEKLEKSPCHPVRWQGRFISSCL